MHQRRRLIKMNKSFLGNEAAFHYIKSHINGDSPGPMIFLGKEGLGKTLAAQDAACYLLHCTYEELIQHPDYYVLDKKQDTIKVEDALELIQHSNISAVYEKKVFHIRHIEKMNVQAQNKILKLLEDRTQNNLFIMTANRDCLLDTIKSRCTIISFQALSETEIRTYLLEQDVIPNDIPLISYLCDFCPYLYEQLQEPFKKFKAMYQQFITLQNKESIFSILHLIKEKDTEHFYDCHAEHYNFILQMFQYIFYHLIQIKLNIRVPEEVIADMKQLNDMFTLPQSYRASRAIEEHRNRWYNNLYTKNDFFDLIREIIQDDPIQWNCL